MKDEIDPGDRSADNQGSSITTTKNESKRYSHRTGKGCISKTPGLTAVTPADKASEERRWKRLVTEYIGYRLHCEKLCQYLVNH